MYNIFTTGEAKILKQNVIKRRKRQLTKLLFKSVLDGFKRGNKQPNCHQANPLGSVVHERLRRYRFP